MTTGRPPPAVDAAVLERELEQADPESRRIATQRISRVRGPSGKRLLLMALGDEDWRVRKEAAKVAPAVEPRQEVVLALAGALAEKENVGLRNAAVEAMVEIGADAVSAAATAMSSLDADGRKLAIEILGGVPHPRGMRALVEALGDADPNLRAAAAEALGNAKSLGPEAVEQAIEALTRRLAEDQTLVQIAALDALASLGAHVPWKTFEPFTADPVLRRKALTAARRSHDPEALLALATALGDFSAGVAEDAAVGLAEHLTERSIPPSLVTRARERLRADARAQDRIRILAAELDEPRVRGAALVLLGLLADKADVRRLVEALSDEELSTYAEAGLRLFGAPAVKPVLEAGRESGLPVRAATLSLVPLLCESPQPFALDELRQALFDASPDVAVAAIQALGASGEGEDVAAIAPFATHPDTRLAGTACSALKALAARHPAAARRLVARMDATGPGAVVGCVLIEAVPDPNDPRSDVAYLRAALDHRDVRVRRAAVDALSQVADPGSADAVAIALADEEDDVVLGAVRALGKLRRLAPLLTLLKTTRDPGIVAATLLALVEASPDDAFAAARPILSGGDPVLASAAVEAVGRLDGPRKEEGLRLALGHPNPEVVCAALALLAHEGSDEATRRIARSLDHDAPEVRRSAALLLGAEGGAFAQAALRTRLENEGDARVRDAISEALSARAAHREDEA